jgi:GNAT superfamily N-acetyltransferase
VTVPRLSLPEFDDLLQLRMLLEGEAAERGAARLDAAGQKLLGTLCQRMARSLARGDANDYLGANEDFHVRLYRAVGDEWYWRDRNAWSDARLDAYLARPTVAVWECLVGDETAGFFELEQNDDNSVEIAYFGLIEQFIGRGLGKAMLTRAVEEAWAMGASRVWLHTCTLDSPHALPNYKARGFEEIRTETYMLQLPGDP